MTKSCFQEMKKTEDIKLKLTLNIFSALSFTYSGIKTLLILSVG